MVFTHTYNVGVNMSEILLEGKGPYPFKVRATLYQDIKELDQLKLTEALQQMADAISSQRFKNFCNDYAYKTYSCRGALWWRRCTSFMSRGFRKRNAKSQMEVYEHILQGSEVNIPEKDREADIHFVIDYRFSRNVIGYTYPNSIKQWIYYNFFKRYSHSDIAGNLAHEWAHKLGYGHSFKYNSLRKHTVPYAVGYFVRDYKGE